MLDILTYIALGLLKILYLTSFEQHFGHKTGHFFLVLKAFKYVMFSKYFLFPSITITNTHPVIKKYDIFNM